MSKRLEEIIAKADAARLQAEAHYEVVVAQATLAVLPELGEEYDEWVELGTQESEEFDIFDLPGMYIVVDVIVVPYLMAR